MTKLNQINNAIQKGKGKAANVLGQIFQVYRLSNASTGSVTSGSPVISNYPAKISRYTARTDVENSLFELLVFAVLGDNRQLQLSDFLYSDPTQGGDGANYVVVSMRPLHNTLAVRAEASVSITRPAPKGGSASQQPVSGAVAATGYGGGTKATELLCILNNGTYDFSATGSPAAIPCGIQPQSRKGLTHDPKDLPTQVSDEYFVAFLPDLPGIQVQETDILSFPNGDRYLILEVFTTNDVGTAGWVVHLVKMAV